MMELISRGRLASSAFLEEFSSVSLLECELCLSGREFLDACKTVLLWSASQYTIFPLSNVTGH